MNNRVLITGASGALGPCIVRAFTAAGFAVRTFSLEAVPENTFPEAVEIIIGDITDPTAVDAAMIGVDKVVHLAALLHIVDPSETMKPEYRRINVGGTENVIRAALREGVQRIVYFSTIAVYGPGNGKLLSEESPALPNTIYAKTKLEGEGVILDAKRPDGIPLGTILRLGAVYGLRIKGNYRRLVQALGRKRFIPVGDGRNRRTLVYERDVAEAALIALKNRSAAGRIFNVTDGRIYSMKEIIETLSRCLGRRPPRYFLPAGWIRLLAGGMEMAWKALGRKPPVSRETIDKYVEDMAVDGSRIQKVLGFTPRYSLAGGWLEVIEEMRREGDL